MAVKHAIKSTEFYVTMFVELMLAVNMMWKLPEFERNVMTITCTAGMVLTAAIYVIGRSIIKQKDAAK